MLVYIGFKLLNVPKDIKITSCGRSGTAIFACTVFGVVCIERLTGMLMGLGLSAAILMYRMSHVELDLRAEGKRFELPAAPLDADFTTTTATPPLPLTTKRALARQRSCRCSPPTRLYSNRTDNLFAGHPIVRYAPRTRSTPGSAPSSAKTIWWVATLSMKNRS